MKRAGISLLLGLFGLLVQSKPSHAQLNCPVACQASSTFCSATSTSATSCPAAWRGKRCANMPCAYRQACGCGGCLLGCNTSACSVCKGVPGTRQNPVPQNPQSPDSSTPGGSNVPGTPDSQTPKTPVSTAPLSTECKNRCDRNNDGIISKSDFADLLGNAQTPETQELLTFCSQSCPMTDDSGSTQPSVPPVKPTKPAPTGGTDPDLIRKGDCSSAAKVGMPDGTVDIHDIELFRQEFNKEVETMACDMDKSGEVDIIDFSNYIRPAFASQFEDSEQSPTAYPSTTDMPRDPTLGVPSIGLTVVPSVPSSITSAPTSSVLRP